MNYRVSGAIHSVRYCIALGAAALLIPSAACRAEVTLYPLFSNDMILQRDKPVPVWGSAKPGEKISLSFGKQKHQTVADAAGNWRVLLGKMKAARNLELKIIGENEVVLRNVAVGDVYVCSGQSNMQWPLDMSSRGREEIAVAKHPDIRLFTVPRKVAGAPQNGFADKVSWQSCDPLSVAGFSAVAYYFGRDLQQELGVPIGLINSSWGGTIIQAWTSAQTLEKRDDLREQTRQAAALLQATTDETVAADLKKWEADPTAFPAKPIDQRTEPNHPAALYNGMIAPLVQFPVRGAIWYQGEANARDAKTYQSLFPELIRDWRERWGARQDGSEFGFYFVQLANYMARVPEPVQSGWAELREAQAMALKVPRTGMATIIDIGEADDIHPRNKKDVGHRLALVTLAREYDGKVEYSGPVYAASKIDARNREVRIRWMHAFSLSTTDGKPPRAFAVLGKDEKWYAAEARIDGNEIVLRSPVEPVAVRYAWADNPDVNLTNAAGLPATPFRTDVPK